MCACFECISVYYFVSDLHRGDPSVFHIIPITERKQHL